MLASTGRTVLCQTLILQCSDSDHETARAAKRADRGVEENDEGFSDVDFLSILGLEPQPIRS